VNPGSLQSVLTEMCAAGLILRIQTNPDSKSEVETGRNSAWCLTTKGHALLRIETIDASLPAVYFPETEIQPAIESVRSATPVSNSIQNVSIEAETFGTVAIPHTDVAELICAAVSEVQSNSKKQNSKPVKGLRFLRVHLQGVETQGQPWKAGQGLSKRVSRTTRSSSAQASKKRGQKV
jgi:hypothetical protein